MPLPLVSVLMPVHNRQFVVGDAIRSIQDQTFDDWELIILDDVSTDQTLEVCRSLEKQDSRIHVYQNSRNMGAGLSRNRLLKHARGRYVAVHDSDDISLPHRFEHEIKVLETKPQVGLVSAVTEWIDSDGSILRYYPEKLYAGEQYPQNNAMMIEDLLLGCHIANSACMFRKSIVEKTPAPYGSFRVHEDWYFFLYMAHHSLIWGIPEVLVKMRRGQAHTHLSQNEGFMYNKILPFVHSVYCAYRNEPGSLINRSLYRKSVFYWLNHISSILGNRNGCFQLARVLLRDPASPQAWRFLWRLNTRALRMLKRQLLQLLPAR